MKSEDEKALKSIESQPPIGSAYYWPGTTRLPAVKPIAEPVSKLRPPKRKVKKRNPGISIPDHVRRMGIYLLAGRGSGKSRMLGRIIGWQDLWHGVPQVIFDPVGTTISNLLDKVIRQPAWVQEKLWSRIKYIDMSGGKLYGRVAELPLYYRLGEADSFNDIASRYIEAVKRLNPELQMNPKLGLNAIIKVGGPLGKVLAALGWQITEASKILANPSLFTNQFEVLGASTSDRGLREAVGFFTRQSGDYWQSNDWLLTKDSLETKLAMFAADDYTMAQFGGSIPAMDWSEVIDKRVTVLLDFQGEHNRELRRFKMLWAFLYFYEFLKHRGEGRHLDRPIGLIVDEITALYNFDSQAGSDIFASDMDELINVWSRNANCWLTLSHQELWQIPTEKSRKSLYGLGTKIIGHTDDDESALQLAQDLMRYDPYLEKRANPIWMALNTKTETFSDAVDPLSQYSVASAISSPTIVDKTPIEFTLEEQRLLNSYNFKDLGLFEFKIKLPTGEGNTIGELRDMHIKHIDQGQWPDEDMVDEARRRLSARDWPRVDDVLEQIDARQVQSVSEPVTLASDEPSPATTFDDEPTSVEDTSDQASEPPDWLEGLVG